MFGMMRGIRNRETRRPLCGARPKYISTTLVMTPIATPTMTPVRRGAASGRGRPASSTASSAAPTAYWMKMSIFFKSLRSMKRSGSKSRTSPAMRAGSAEASKRVIGPMPERPATRLSQFASMPMPSGVTRPRPVTTTRRRVPFGAFKARNASAARAGVKVASHVRPVIAGSRDEGPAAVRHPRLRRAPARGALLPGGETEMLEHLRTFYARGARYLTLTWSIASPLGGSSGDDSDGQGLTDVGRRIIDEMERLGMMIDVSHVSDPLFWDVVRYARKPVIASHSSARELANVPRNMSDPMLRAVARNGGAVCVNFGPAFLDQDSYAREQGVFARVRGLGLPPKESWRTVREEVARLPGVPLARLVDHIDHIAKVAGIDHVCLGSDFDGIPATPVGLEDASKLPALTAELVRRGYAPGDIEKILGGNVLRVLAANEPAAGSRR